MSNDLKDLISTPLDLPLIEPTSWDDWWDLWNKESAYTPKVIKTHNNVSSPWKGLEIWSRPGINSRSIVTYDAKNVNRPDLFPSIFDNLDKFPIKIDIVRVVSNFVTVIPHSDALPDKKILSVRSMLYNTNIEPTFNYRLNGQKVYQTLPKDTNTWMYWDHKTKHAADFHHGYTKHLITIYGRPKANYNEYIEKSANMYKDHAIFNTKTME